MTDGGNDDSAVSARPEAEAAAPPPREAPPAPPPPAAKPRRGGGVVAVLVVAIVVVVGVVGTAPFWAPLLPWRHAAPASDQTALHATAARLAQLESAVQTLAAAVHANAGDAATLGQRVAALERRPPAPAGASPQEVAKLQQGMASLGTRLDDTTARLGKMAAVQAAEARPDRTLLAALAALRAAVAGSGPFDGELAAVTALAQGDAAVVAALKPLAAPASLGLPSTALLAQRFAATTAPAILRADAVAPPPPGAGWGARILARLRALVVVRRTDGGGGDAAASAVTRARQALDNGDLAAAVAALKPLRGGPQAAAAPWVAVAQRRLETEGALDSALHQVATRIAAEGH
jgi:hypothetical protein